MSARTTPILSRCLKSVASSRNASWVELRSVSGLSFRACTYYFENDQLGTEPELSSVSYRTENLWPTMKPGSEISTRRSRGKYHGGRLFVQTLTRDALISSFAPGTVSEIP